MRGTDYATLRSVVRNWESRVLSRAGLSLNPKQVLKRSFGKWSPRHSDFVRTLRMFEESNANAVFSLCLAGSWR